MTNPSTEESEPNAAHVEISTGFESGLAKLRDHFDWLKSPEGVLQELRFRLADAERELPRAREEGERERIKQEMEQLRAQIAEQERVVADPVAAAAATRVRIETGIEGQRQPERPQPRVVARAKYVNPPPMTAPTYFQDRHVETELLATFLRAEDTRMVTVVGRGGVGKTAMVCRLLKGVETGRLPDELGNTLGELAVDGIVYLRTPSAHPVSWANLFTDLCRLLPEQTAEPLLQRYRDPHETPTGLMLALLEAFPTGRSVVLLDNFEDLLDPATGAVTEGALDEALRAVLSAPAHGVKVVITTRIAPQPLLLHQPGVQRRIDLDEGLPSPYAEDLLRARDPDGKLGLKTAPDPQLSLARERTRGYPRALEALAGILSADRNTTLAELLDQTSGLPENVVEALVGEAFLRLDPLAQQIMQALAIFPVPVPAVAIDYLLQPYQPAINAAPVLARLVNMQFVRRDAGHYYLHQVDRDYALGRIPDGRAHRPRHRPAAVHPHRASPPRRRLLHPNPQTARRSGKPSTTSPPNWPSSNCATKAATTTPPPRSCSPSTSTTSSNGATTATPSTYTPACSANSPTPGPDAASTRNLGTCHYLPRGLPPRHPAVRTSPDPRPGDRRPATAKPSSPGQPRPSATPSLGTEPTGRSTCTTKP